MVPVIPVALSEAMKAATSATSASVMSLRVWVLLASPSCHCSKVITFAALRLQTSVVALLTDDVFMAMPPIPYEYQGRDIVARFLAGFFGAGRRFHLVPTRANGQPAFGAYLRTARGTRTGTGLIAVALAGERISSLIRFESTALPWFGLPPSLPNE